MHDPWNVETVELDRRITIRRAELRLESPGRRADDVAEYLEAVWVRERGQKVA